MLLLLSFFDGVKFRGTVDSVRQVRQRYYYHVTYSDGDEEEMSQAELRDGYVLGLSEEIKAQWLEFKKHDKGKDAVETEEASDVETGDSEGREFDKRDYESELRDNTNPKRNAKKNRNELSGMVLPKLGDKSVAAEAFGKLNDTQKELVKSKVNQKTKQVNFLHFFFTLLHIPLIIFV